MEEFSVTWEPIGSLSPHPKNPNKHDAEQVKRLAEIIQYQGWRHPIIVSELSGHIVAGHGRLLAAKDLKLKTVPVHYQSFENEEQEYAFLVSDNAIASWAELDLSFINNEVPTLGPDFNIDMLGIKDFTLDVSEKGQCDEDEVPEVRPTTSIRMGDLFILGEHRVLCGDSTDRAQVERLMNNEKADMVFTDPPYGMNLDTDYSQMGNTTSYRKVEGDDKPFYPKHIFDIPADEYWLWGADYYANRIPKYEEGSFTVWTKAHSDEENKVWTSRFELVWVWPKRKKEVWFVRAMQRDSERTGEHPTQKPVELATRAFSVSKSDAKLIVDLYLGSGSTLIACEKTNRKCYGMEIDPIYCQVILDRWAKFTGKDPVREDGTPWSTIKADGETTETTG
jgi:DNA modification methylase